uniref:DNA mismatch repair protein n=1 Tax=Rhodnius prolixus TaxID=13249 RepID=T1I626_RHOPR
MDGSNLFLNLSNNAFYSTCEPCTVPSKVPPQIQKAIDNLLANLACVPEEAPLKAQYTHIRVGVVSAALVIEGNYLEWIMSKVRRLSDCDARKRNGIYDNALGLGSHSRSPCKENRETSRKRGRSATDENNKAPKRARIDVNVTSNEGSEFPSGLQNTPGQDVLDNTFQTKQYIPHHLIGLMYQLDLSVLCSLRKSMYEHKYPSLSLAFGDSEIDAFSNIVLRYKKKSIHIQIENVDKYYIDNNISYARLFTKERRSSSVNSYFGSFVKYLISKSGSVSDNVEYLVVYTNSCLDLTEEKELKKGRLRNFYPFKFDSINIEECDILKDFLFINDNTQESGFYQFSQNKTTREGLLKQLEFLPDMQKGIKERKFPQEEIKEAFLDKLVFAVNQPNREELNSIIKNEIKKNSKAQDDYIALQERILHDLTVPEKHKKLGNYIPGIIYEFNLLMLFLHDMFLHKNMSSISFEGKNHSTSDNITINYKDRITYVKSHNANNSVSYSQLFPSRTQERKNKFSINKHFSLFIEELEKDIEYFIIYTNTGLDLTEEKRLKKGQSKDFYPLKFDSIDTQKKKYKILRDCSCIDVNSLYRFPQKETTKLLSLLKLPPSLQREKEEILPNEKEIKEKFLDKLIFAVNQPNGEGLNSIIGREIEKSNVPYDYEELREITLRWLESHGFGPITKEIMEKLLGDIKNNRSSCQEIQNKNIDEEIKFARSVVGIEGTPTFGKFLDFLVKGEGRKYLEVLEREGIKLTSMSSILNRAGTNAIKAFKDLHNLWFDEKGNKKQYLKTLEENGMNLANMSSVLSRTGSNAAEAFKNLYDLWFDKKGNKTQYLKTLEENGMNLANMSSVLSRAGSNAAEAFKNLYDLWFDEKGNKTQYLKTLEENGMNLANTSNILHGAGSNAVKAFKDLYGLWFDEKGNKTQYLKTLEENGINLTNMSSVLGGAGSNAAEAFKNLYGLWFDEKGNKTQYLKTLEENGINLTNMSSVLSRAGSNAAEAFKNLYGLWFDEKGNKTQYLKTLEENGINLTNMSSILSGAGSNAAEAFKNLHDLWFDEKGNKTQHLETLEENGMNLANMSSVLSRAGSNAAEAFKNLYDLWFNEKGNKTQYLKTLEENGINLTNMSSILSGAGSNAIKAFKNLYDLWFDAEGNKTQYLKTLGENGINLTNMSSVLHRAGSNAAKAFKDLYDLWFDAEGTMINYRVGFTLSSGNKKLLKYAKQTSLFSRLCEMKEEFQNNSLEINEEEDGVKLTGHICKPTVNRGKSDMIYTFVNGRPIKDNLLVGAIRYAYHDFIPSDRYPFATLHLEVPYDQVDVNVHPNKSEVRFQNKRLIYEIVRRGIIKALSTRIGTVAASGLESKGIEEKLLFDASKSQEQVNSGEKKNQKEFYEKRPSLLGNRLMKEFNAPDERKQSLSETFKYRGIDKSSPRKETMVLEREQIDLIENRPLGFARCQVYNTYIIAETGDRLIIVDQHAAHERLVYEYLKQKTSIKRQKLLLPEVVKIENQAGMEMVEMYKDKLFEMGFDIEIESENKVIAREIPAILGAIDVKEMLMDIAVRLTEIEDTLPIEDKQTNKDEIESSGPVMTKKEKALNSVSKSSFLNYLMGEKNEDMEHQEPKQEFKSEESNDEEEDQIKQVSSTWEVLQNNYGIGIKMKNWVNRTENSN